MKRFAVLVVALFLPIVGIAPAAHATGEPGFCIGDCNGCGFVGVNQLIRCVTLAQDPTRADQLVCLFACDANGDGEVHIDELIKAVNHDLFGCPR